jgi:uncharacterized lipoprotein YddW (UPF0748 family)
VIFRTSHAILHKAIIVVFLLTVTTPSVVGQELAGVWLSPDWFFPGSRNYTEQEVRQTARAVFANLKDKNVDSVFLETFLRGYGICPHIEKGERGRDSSVLDYVPGTESHPVYPHLDWSYSVQYDTVLDPLQIFVEEGLAVGIEVHAWIHLFYWRMDNTDIMLPWHNGPTLWGHLMDQYLQDQQARFDFVQEKSIRPGYESLVNKELEGDLPLSVLREASKLFSVGCDANQLERLLKSNGIESGGHPIGTLITQILKSGGERPDFLLMASDDDPFPAPRGHHLRSIYVDPEHPEVRRSLVEAISNIAQNHPGLAGIHLDHIRYPVDGQGLGKDSGVVDGRYRYFNATSQQEMAQYRHLTETLQRRQEALSSIVVEIAETLPRGMQLSAAVLPLYYRDRDTGNFRTSGYDYAAQAWMDWPVDFVVPMMYEYHPYLIRTLVDKYQSLANSARPENPIAVYPGISRLRYTRDGSVGPKGWVFFDLTLARDVKNPLSEAEDLDFGGE